ncbi:MAG: inverse autotransporter beta domain-containing protein, partial [Planctomycetota bacterium]
MGQRMIGGMRAVRFRSLLSGWLAGSMLFGGVAEAQFAFPGAAPIIVAPDGSIPGRGGFAADGRFAGPRSIASERLRQPMTAKDVQPRGTVNVNGGNGLGYDNGYASFGGFVPFGLTDVDLIFVEGRGYTSFEERGGANLGAGVRKYLPDYDVLFGFSGWLDVDGGNESLETFYRAGVSGEFVSRWFEFRVNGYLPVDDESYVVSQGTLSTTPFFQGNQIKLFTQTNTIDQFGGFDVEFGGPTPLLARYGTSTYFGGYYLSNDDPAASESGGFMFRLAQRVNENIEVGMRLTQDNIFDTNIWVTADFRTPRGSWWDFFKGRWFGLEPVSHRFDYEVERNYRIPTDVRSEVALTPLIDPNDGQPYVVQHLAPEGTAFGIPLAAPATPAAGAFEVPFASFAAADVDPLTPGVQLQAGTDLFFVDNGPTGSSTFAAPGTIFVPDGMRVLGRSESHIVTSSNFAPVTVPALPGRTRAIVSNSGLTAGPVFRVGSNTEISGLQIDGSFTNVLGATVTRVGIDTPTGGIGDRGFAGSDIDAPFNFNRNTFTSVAAAAIVETNPAGPAGAALSPSNFSENAIDFTSVGVRVTSTDGAITPVAVTSNTFTSSSAGEDTNSNGILENGEDVDGNNQLDPGAAVELIADGTSTATVPPPPGTLTPSNSTAPSVIDALVTGNTITGTGKGVRVLADGSSRARIRSSLNAITGTAVAGSGYTYIAEGADIDALHVSDTFTGNAGAQISVTAAANSAVDTLGNAPGTRASNVALVTNSSTIAMDDESTDGIAVDARDSNIFVSLTGGNSFTQFDGDGDNSTVDVVAGGVDIDVVDTTDAADARLTFLAGSLDGTVGTGNTFDGLAGAGIAIRSSGFGDGVGIDGVTTNVFIADQTITNTSAIAGGFGLATSQNEGSAIDIEIFDDSRLIAFNNPTSNAALAGGVPTAAVGFGFTTLDETEYALRNVTQASKGQPFLNSQIDGNFLGQTPAGVAGGNAGHGVQVTVTGLATVSNLLIGNENTVAADGNIVANNGLDGFQFVRTGDAIVNNVIFSDNIATANRDGFAFDIAGGQADLIDIRIDDNQSVANNDDGLDTIIRGDAQFFFTADGNAFDSNGGSGYEADTDIASPADLRDMGGLITNSTFNGNGAYGMDLNSDFGLVLTVGQADLGDGTPRG